ncbi:hypothetical protein [Pontiella desulfatans]|nr:hypothetical protein [Pontiella desulfatans]
MVRSMIAGMALATAVQADVVTQLVNLAEWDEGSTWSSGIAPTNGNDYTSTLWLRVSDASSAFGGDSFTLLTGSQLQLRDSVNTFVVPNLVMDGGAVYAGTGANITFALDGTIDVVSDSAFTCWWGTQGTTGPRNLRILSEISGSGDLSTSASSASTTHFVAIENTDNSGYSGDWTATRGTFIFATGGSVGTGSIAINAGAGLTIGGDWDQSAAGATLSIGDSGASEINLSNSNWKVESMTFGGAGVPPGTYTAAELNTFGDTVFVNGGTIEVVTGPAPPGDVYFVSDKVNWTDPTAWSDGVAATNINNYYVTNNYLFSPVSPATFPGKSLTIRGEGTQFQLKVTGSEVISVDNLTMDGGVLVAGTGNDVESKIDGEINVISDSRFQGYMSSEGVTRDLRVLSKVYNTEPDVEVEMYYSNTESTHTIYIDNAVNEFSGTWVVYCGTNEFANAGAVGTGSIEVLNNGKLRILGDWNQSEAGASLTVNDSANANVDLGGYDWAVSNLVFGGSSVAAGTYTATELNALGANPVFSGSGTLTVGTVVNTLVYMDVLASAQTWTSATIWDNDMAPTSGFDYVVPSTGNLKSPDGNVAFQGDSLTVLAGGKVQVRGKEDLGTVTTIADLRFSGGTGFGTLEFPTLASGTGNVANQMDGHILNSGYTMVSGYYSATATRGLRIYSQIEGDGIFRTTASSSSTETTVVFDVMSPSNTYSGVWQSHRGMLRFESGGAAGPASIEVFAGAGLTIDGDWNESTNNTSLTVADSAGTVVELGSNTWIIANVTVGTNLLAEAEYTVAELNSYLTNPAFTGTTGKIKVGVEGDVPNPPTLEGEMNGGDITFTWTDSRFKLQSRPQLTFGDWVDVPGGVSSPFIVPATNDVEFLRLIEK